ncbi:RNA-directed DNA polymerase, eukaryota, partial [Tanacetum coccineum]
MIVSSRTFGWEAFTLCSAFINVLNLDRLIENLKTIWIGRFHLSANPARFERPKASYLFRRETVPLSGRSNLRVLKEAENSVDRVSSESYSNGVKIKEGGSILEILEEMITVGQTMRFSMEGLGSKAKKDWIKELISKHKLEGFSFTWAHPSATKMSKLDRFLMSNGLLSAFPLISAICLDRHLSDHRPILLKENSFTLDDSNGLSKDLKSKLCDIDKVLDQGGVTDDILLSRLEVLKQLHDVQSSNNRDIMQKAKIRWAIEGDENSKYFHAIINKKCANLSVKVFNNDQILELESPISNEDIRTAYWTVVGPDFCIAVKWFFDHGDFAIGCNSSFVALIPKVLDPKVVSDYRPISLIGSLYKGNFLGYLDDVLISFGFGPKWRSWIRGSLSSRKASILVNGSPTTEFHLYRGLKQGDPLAPFLFLLIMESLHLSFSRAVEAGIFKGYKIDHSTMLSHLLRYLLKSHLLGVGIPDNCVAEAAKSIGCLIMKAPFK